MINFSQILQKLKEVFKKMVGNKSIENVLHVTPVVSSQMQSSIELWEFMYKGQSPWLKEATYNDPSVVKSLGLPQLIASEKARTALLEFESEITTPMKEEEKPREEAGDNIVERFQQSNTDPNAPTDAQPQQTGNPASMYNTAQFHPQATVKELVPKGPTQRAEYLNKTYKKKLLKQLRKEIEYGIALGGLVIKPYVVINHADEMLSTEGDNVLSLDASKIDKADIEFDYVLASSFYPLAFNGSGDIIEAAFLQKKVDKDYVYTRLEHHKYDSSIHRVTVTNMAFRTTANAMSGAENDLGQEVPLTSVPEWQDIQPITYINNVDRLLFAYFKMPEANTIDMYSPLGVSGFDKAISLIKDADIQYSRLLWEYEGGELAIDIDRDALRDYYDIDNQGNRVLKTGMGHLQQRLYRPVELTAEGDTYNQYAPSLRDDSYIRGLNTILMHIEDITGLSRGTISEVDIAEARTATELKILKQRSYQANVEIQKAIQDCLDDVIYIMDVLCDLYEITPKGEYEVSYEWDDSILVDVDTELGKRMTLMDKGIMSKEEVRMWYMGETEKQAKEALLKVQEENRVAVEDNIMTQMNFNQLGLDSTKQQSPDKLRESNNQ